jgi:hypothetical protein
VRTCDLISEGCRAQANINTGHRERLANLGISALTIGRGLVGVERVLLSSDGRLYQPDENGEEVFITPARLSEDPGSPETINHELVAQFGFVCDLVAWSPEFPRRWATRCDLAGWLGAYGPQSMTPSPVPIFRSVLSWLRHDAEGLVVLARSPLDAWRILAICRELRAEDHLHQRELQRVLSHPFPVPPITVPSLVPEGRVT